VRKRGWPESCVRQIASGSTVEHGTQFLANKNWFSSNFQ